MGLRSNPMNDFPAVLHDPDLHEAVHRCNELWLTTDQPVDFLKQMGVTEKDFDSVCDVMGAHTEKTQGMLLIGIGIGRALGIIQATADPETAPQP